MVYSIIYKIRTCFFYHKATKTIAEEIHNDTEMHPRVNFPEEFISCPRNRFALSSFEGFHGSKLGDTLGCSVAIDGESDGFKEG